MPADQPVHFTFILVEKFSHLAFACSVEPLRIANLVRGRALCSRSFASEDGTAEQCVSLQSRI